MSKLKKGRKGIVLSTIAYFIIALITVTLILMLVSGKLSPGIKHGYCSFLLGINAMLPLPEYLKPSVPAYCKEAPPFSQVVIESSDPDSIAYQIASHTLACFKSTGELELGRDRVCYELIIKEIDGEVGESMTRDELPEGYKDIMTWKAGKVNLPKSIGIYYNATSVKIEVI